jgi:CheY-like chemotaxis protein
LRKQLDTRPAELPLADLARRRVLVVDDHGDYAAMLESLLEVHGFQVLSVNNGEAAVVAVDQFTPHAVLMDVRLPGMDGYQTARAIRQLANVQQPYIAAVTVYPNKESNKLASAAGIDSVHLKPADIRELLGVLGGVR